MYKSKDHQFCKDFQKKGLMDIKEDMAYITGDGLDHAWSILRNKLTSEEIFIVDRAFARIYAPSEQAPFDIKASWVAEEVFKEMKVKGEL
ncbi:hypothetical protein D5F52_26500 (plasmid) [Brevibacillus laterosporus]|uniref:hypothetical protein n=1 Tax=Brevibacillus laterosporus TaxID=1465 RepID=UPI000E6CCCC5|nr:hypothetical protein [Brevibacillus laterosporus]AYB41707.1 hypothetical protein D5F52_26500 [Brevibacillus laterosporus]